MSNNVYANAVQQHRIVHRQIHEMRSGMTLIDMVQAATQIFIKAQINGPGSEPKIVVAKTDDNGKKIYAVPKNCEFEKFGVLPYGWRVNPYDVTRYPLDNQGLAQLFVDSIARGRIAYHSDLKTIMSFDGKKMGTR